MLDIINYTIVIFKMSRHTLLKHIIVKNSSWYHLNNLQNKFRFIPAD